MQAASALELYADMMESRSQAELGGNAWEEHCAAVRSLAAKLRLESRKSQSQRFTQGDVDLLHRVADGLTTDLANPDLDALRPRLRANAESWNRIAGTIRRAGTDISLEQLPE